MKKRLTILFALPVLMMWGPDAVATVDGGRQYSSGILEQPEENQAVLDCIYKIYNLPQTRDFIAQQMPGISDEVEHVCSALQNRSVLFLPDLTLVLKNGSAIKMIHFMPGFREILVFSRNSARFSFEEGAEHTHGAATLTGHFYKPYLQRPELFF